MKIDKVRMLASQKGFTLIELMIVIAIIGILAAVAIPNFIEYKNKSYCTATVNDVKATAGALADYFANPANVTASVSFRSAAAPARPFIHVGNAAAGTDNTLILSASTTGMTVTKVSSNYLIVGTEGAGNCPTKVTNADSHWTGGGGTAATYSMTM